MYKPEIVINPKIINNGSHDCISVLIKNEEYELCEETSKNYWANSKKGAYGEGLGKTVNDEFRPVRTGLLGEMAFAKVFNTEIDLDYRAGGDIQDCILENKYTVDIKCAMSNYGKGIIYYKNEWGGEINLTKDIYVFCYLESERRKIKKAVINIVGTATSEELRKYGKIKKGIRGNGHENYEIEYSDLRPIMELYKENMIRSANG